MFLNYLEYLELTCMNSRLNAAETIFRNRCHSMSASMAARIARALFGLMMSPDRGGHTCPRTAVQARRQSLQLRRSWFQVPAPCHMPAHAMLRKNDFPIGVARVVLMQRGALEIKITLHSSVAERLALCTVFSALKGRLRLVQEPTIGCKQQHESQSHALQDIHVVLVGFQAGILIDSRHWRNQGAPQQE